MFRRRPVPQEPVAWLVVGLGNPGGEYKGTRHNVGFAVVERLAEAHGIKLNRGRSRALVGIGSVDGERVALAKPLTYMNLSGQAVAPLMKELGLFADRVLVVADDLDLPLGKLRLRGGGGSGGHNGHKSIAASLQTQAYPRLKVGIGSVKQAETIDHVLSRFEQDELEDATASIHAAANTCQAVVSEDWDRALQVVERFNAPPPLPE